MTNPANLKLSGVFCISQKVGLIALDEGQPLVNIAAQVVTKRLVRRSYTIFTTMSLSLSLETRSGCSKYSSTCSIMLSSLLIQARYPSFFNGAPFIVTSKFLNQITSSNATFAYQAVHYLS